MDRVTVLRGLRKIALALAALLVLATVLACRPPFSKVKKEAQGERTAEVQAGTFRVLVTATGKVEPNRKVQITSKASGEIIALPFEAGDAVPKGELLVRLKPDDEQRSVSRKEADLNAAQARLSKARNELELARSNHVKSLTDHRASVELAKSRMTEVEAKYQRQANLFKEKMVAEEALETARMTLEQARTERTRAEAVLKDTENQTHQLAVREQDVALSEVEVSNARIALEEARERLAETEVRATMDGVLTERKVERGQVISSAIMNVGGGTQLMTLSDLSRLFVVASVDEADIGGVQVGQRAMITADAFPNEKFEGRVHHIAPIGVEVNSVVSFDVKIEVEGEGLKKLRPGMTADVAVTTEEAPNTIWVQSEAVKEGPEGMFVELPGEGSPPKKVIVEVGISDGLNTEIKSGVTPGQKILVGKNKTKGVWER